MTEHSKPQLRPGEISDALLIEFYCDQHQDIAMDSALRMEINAALCTSHELAARYADIERQMQDLRLRHQADLMPESTRLRLERNFARHVRLQEKPSQPLRWRWLMAAAGVGAVMAITLQNIAQPMREGALAQEAVPQATLANPALDPLKPYSAHMLDAQMVLANLGSAPRAEQRRLLEELIAQNRAFAQRADAQGLPEVRRVLQALEPVLTELSRVHASPERQQLLEQLDFETRILANRWHSAPAQSAQTKIDL